MEASKYISLWYNCCYCMAVYCRCASVCCAGLWKASSADRCRRTDVWRPGVSVHWRLGWQRGDRWTSACRVLGHWCLFVDHEWYYATSSLQIPQGWFEFLLLLHQMVLYVVGWYIGESQKLPAEQRCLLVFVNICNFFEECAMYLICIAAIICCCSVCCTTSIIVINIIFKKYQYL